MALRLKCFLSQKALVRTGRRTGRDSLSVLVSFCLLIVSFLLLFFFRALASSLRSSFPACIWMARRDAGLSRTLPSSLSSNKRRRGKKATAKFPVSLGVNNSSQKRKKKRDQICTKQRNTCIHLQFSSTCQVI